MKKYKVSGRLKQGSLRISVISTALVGNVPV